MMNEPGRRVEASLQDGQGRHKVPPLEWATALLGLILAAGSIGLILYDAFDQETPPKLHAQVEQLLRIDNHYLVKIVVTNDGGSTAAKVKVEGRLRKGEKTVETASTTFDYVPAHSQARGGMLFTYDPGAHDMTLEPKAYTEP
jgi:uncharacterized protein (TIGR02588 family)